MGVGKGNGFVDPSCLDGFSSVSGDGSVNFSDCLRFEEDFLREEISTLTLNVREGRILGPRGGGGGGGGVGSRGFGSLGGVAEM